MDVWDVIVAAASGELVRTRKSSRERATSVSSDFSLHTVAPSQQDRAAGNGVGTPVQHWYTCQSKYDYTRYMYNDDPLCQ